MTRRAIAAAVIVSIGTAGGVISGQIYQAKQKPRYLIGHSISFACVALQTVLIVILRLILMLINRHRDQLNDEQKKQQIDKYGDEQSAGDRHPDFRYTL